MPPWLWFVVIVVVGSAILFGALLLDRRRARRVSGLGEPAPLRGHSHVDSHVPHYLTQEDVDYLPSPAQGASQKALRRGTAFAFGHAHPDFATSKNGASHHAPQLLLVDGEVTAMRELMAVLTRVSEDSPLIIVATGFHPEVVTTLAANRRALRLPVVAAAADAAELHRLSNATGAEALSPTDLQGGYVPPSALGRAVHWGSTSTQAWVELN